MPLVLPSVGTMGVTERADVGHGAGASTADCIGYVELHDAMSSAGSTSQTGSISGAGRNDTSGLVGRDTAFATMGGSGRNDAATGAATWGILGSFGATGRNDSFVGITPPNAGTISRTEGRDSANLAGTCIRASLAYTEHHDTLSGSSSFADAGTLSKVAGSDVLAGSGIDRAVGSLGFTGGSDNAALAATSTFHATANLLAGGLDVLAAVGRYGPSGILGCTARPDSFAGGSGLASMATMGVVESHDVSAMLSGSLAYHVYSNTNASFPTGYATAGAIDYTLPIATTTGLSYVTATLAFPGVWRFGVRAFDPITSLEEENLDAAVTIILDGSGVDITNRPKAPTNLRALARAGGTIRVEWNYNTINPSPMPTGFHVYVGIGALTYVSPTTTLSFAASIGGTFVVDVPGLVDGTTYTIGVRAVNATAEEPNTITVNCTADATGPAAVVSLTATAV
jgi:hypothetical protein